MSPGRTHPAVSGTLLRAGLIGGAATASGIALTATSGWLIVEAATMPPILTLMVAIVAVRAFGIARPVLRYAERLVAHGGALTALVERRVEMYASLVPLTPARLGAHSRADVLTGAVRDLDDDVDAQVRVVVPLIAAGTAALLAIVAAAVIHPPAGAVVAAVAVSMAVRGVVAYRRERPAQARGLAARADAAKVCTTVTGQALELQAIGALDDAADWLAQAHRQVRRAAGRQGGIRAGSVAWQQATTWASTTVMALLVAPEVGGRIGAPVAALLVLLPVALADVSATLPDALGAWAKASAARQRLHDLLSQTPAVAGIPATDAAPPATWPEAPELRLAGMRARWRPDRAPLPPVDLRVRPGERLALIGANGAGKSTVLAVLARHLDPWAGEYAIDGQDALTVPVAATRARFALVDDEPHLFASTLRENLRFARPGSDDPALISALRTAGLGDWFAGLPDGLDTALGSTGRGVSGGERARIAIARAVLSRRRAVLLDEPVAHLDHATAEAVLADLAAATAGCTVVMVSHRPDGMAGFDTVLDLTARTPVAPAGELAGRPG